MSDRTRYTVVGAGNGGKTMAAHLALLGHEVTLYNRTPGHVAAIRRAFGHILHSYAGNRCKRIQSVLTIRAGRRNPHPQERSRGQPPQCHADKKKPRACPHIGSHS